MSNAIPRRNAPGPQGSNVVSFTRPGEPDVFGEAPPPEKPINVRALVSKIHTAGQELFGWNSNEQSRLYIRLVTAAKKMHLSGKSFEEFRNSFATHEDVAPWAKAVGNSFFEYFWAEGGEQTVWLRAKAKAKPTPTPDADEDNASETKSTLRRLPMDKLLTQPFPFDFIEGVFFDGQASTITGRNSAGKTFFVIDAAMHVATGQKWRGHDVAQRNVLYIALEGATGIRERVEAWGKHHKVDPHTIPFAVMDGSMNLLRNDKATEQDVLAFARQCEAKWIIIETLARLMPGGNESGGEDMGTVIQVLNKLRRATGAHVTVVHHLGKDKSKGSRG